MFKHLRKGGPSQAKLGLLLLLCITVNSLYGQDAYKQFKLLEKETGSAIATPTFSAAHSITLTVSDQKEFDDIDQNIKSAIKKGFKNIIVNIGPGTYYYKNSHVYLNTYADPELNIKIAGKDASLIPAGDDYVNKGQYRQEVDFNACFITDNLVGVDLFGKLRYAASPVEVIDRASGLCRIPVDYKNGVTEGMRIQITHWYHCSDYKIEKIRNGYAYFKVADLDYSNYKKCYNINDDTYYAKKNPRYAIYNEKQPDRIYIDKGIIHFPAKFKYLHECKASRFLCLYKMTIGGFDLSGLNFIGSAPARQLIYINDVKSRSVAIRNCTFKFIHSNILDFVNSNNLLFEGNTLDKCYDYGLLVDQKSDHVEIANNRFMDFYLSNRPMFCTKVQGDNYYIHDNIFKNINRAAIAVGANYNAKTEDIYGVIENNDIWNDAEFNESYHEHMFIDGGAIYLSTKNRCAIVRYNRIHDYNGMSSTRGIYCDDGCKNAKIYGNVIWNITNGKAVFSWRSTAADKNVPDANSGIVFMYNIIGGNYSFDERTNSNSIHGSNVVFAEDPDVQSSLINFTSVEKDIRLANPLIIEQKIKFSEEGLKRVKALPTYDKIKKYLSD